MIKCCPYDIRWGPLEKIAPYTDIIEFCEQDIEDFKKDSKKHLRERKSEILRLKNEINALKADIREKKDGDQAKLHALLKENMGNSLVFKGKHPLKILADIEQSNSVMVKELNKLQYMKKAKMERLKEKMIQIEEIKARASFGYFSKSALDMKKQLLNQIENAEMYRLTADRVQKYYKSVINVMTQDAMFFEHIVHKISQDIIEQGDLAEEMRIRRVRLEEENEELRKEVFQMKKDALTTMQKRQRIKEKIENLLHAKSRKVMDSIEGINRRIGKLALAKKSPTLDMDMEKEYTHIMNRLCILARRTKANSIDDVFKRAIEVENQKQSLLNQIELCKKEYATLNSKIQHAKQSLMNMESSQRETVRRYDEEESELRQKVDKLNAEINETNENRANEARIMWDVRCAFYSMCNEITGWPEVAKLLNKEEDKGFKETSHGEEEKKSKETSCGTIDEEKKDKKEADGEKIDQGNGGKKESRLETIDEEKESIQETSQGKEEKKLKETKYETIEEEKKVLSEANREIIDNALNCVERMRIFLKDIDEIILKDHKPKPPTRKEEISPKVMEKPKPKKEKKKKEKKEEKKEGKKEEGTEEEDKEKKEFQERFEMETEKIMYMKMRRRMRVESDKWANEIKLAKEDVPIIQKGVVPTADIDKPRKTPVRKSWTRCH